MASNVVVIVGLVRKEIRDSSDQNTAKKSVHDIWMNAAEMLGMFSRMVAWMYGPLLA